MELDAAVGAWWSPDHQVDVVGLDADRQVAITGECKWRNRGFGWDDLETYLAHVQALARATPVRPDVLHVLFSKQGLGRRHPRSPAVAGRPVGAALIRRVDAAVHPLKSTELLHQPETDL